MGALRRPVPRAGQPLPHGRPRARASGLTGLRDSHRAGLFCGPAPVLRHVSRGRGLQTSRVIPEAKRGLWDCVAGTRVNEGHARPLEEARPRRCWGTDRGSERRRLFPALTWHRHGDPQGAAHGVSAPGRQTRRAAWARGPRLSHRVARQRPAHTVVIHTREQTGVPRRPWSGRSGGAGWEARVQRPGRPRPGASCGEADGSPCPSTRTSVHGRRAHVVGDAAG